ncbi:MAG: DUF4253 domain-containing protein [Planctomycetota bacterium]
MSERPDIGDAPTTPEHLRQMVEAMLPGHRVFIALVAAELLLPESQRVVAADTARQLDAALAAAWSHSSVCGYRYGTSARWREVAYWERESICPSDPPGRRRTDDRALLVEDSTQHAPGTVALDLIVAAFDRSVCIAPAIFMAARVCGEAGRRNDRWLERLIPDDAARAADPAAAFVRLLWNELGRRLAVREGWSANLELAPVCDPGLLGLRNPFADAAIPWDDYREAHPIVQPATQWLKRADRWIMSLAGCSPAIWQELRDAAPHTGWWPLYASSNGVQDALGDGGWEMEQDPSYMPLGDILADAGRLNLDDWVDQRDQDAERHYGPDYDDVLDEHPGDSPRLPGGRGMREGSHAFQRGHVILVPSGKPWYVPAWLGYGGWNDCPEPAIHCNVWRDWHAAWGATLVEVEDSTLTGLPMQLPDSRAAATRLADQQRLYNMERISGFDSIGRLATDLCWRPLWSFWWD